MLRKQFILICLGAVVLSVAGITLAAAVKVALVPYDNPVIGIAEPDASGHAILNYAKGADKTEVQVNCWGLSQEGDYTVYLYDSGWISIGSFTLRKNGSGNLHVSLAGDQSGATRVAVNNPDGYTRLDERIEAALADKNGQPHGSGALCGAASTFCAHREPPIIRIQLTAGQRVNRHHRPLT